jgi:NADH-quinone oxidoreductase subunit J
VGAVMVFMVYVIMLLDARDPAFLERYGRVLVPGAIIGVLLTAVLGYAVTRGGARSSAAAAAGDDTAFLVQPFSAEFLQQYWLHFELTSVLLVAAVVAAIAVIKGGRRNDG